MGIIRVNTYNYFQNTTKRCRIFLITVEGILMLSIKLTTYLLIFAVFDHLDI